MYFRHVLFLQFALINDQSNAFFSSICINYVHINSTSSPALSSAHLLDIKERWKSIEALVNKFGLFQIQMKSLGESTGPVRFAIFPLISLFHDGGRCPIETSPLICSANQWTGFYMITASVMKELRLDTLFPTIKLTQSCYINTNISSSWKLAF